MSAQARQSGMALLVVLWTIALLSLLVGASSRAARIEGRSAGFHSREVQAVAIAESGIWAALDTMLSSEIERPTSYTFAVAGGTVDVRVEPVSARVNVNVADPSTLASLLDGSTLTAGQRSELIARVLDWRGVGAERSGVALDDRVKNAPFYTVDELRHVDGMDEASYRRIAPFLTVFGSDAGPDMRFASDELARTLGTAAQRPPRGEREPEPLPSVGVMNMSAIGSVGDVRAHVVAIIYLTGRSTRPFEILSWHDAVPGALEH